MERDTIYLIEKVTSKMPHHLNPGLGNPNQEWLNQTLALYLMRNLKTYQGSQNQSQSDLWDHPFKTSALFRGGGVKNLPNLPTDSSKKLPTVGG